MGKIEEIYEYQDERSPKRCPYCGTILNEYLTDGGGDGVVYTRTETYCHSCKRYVTYYSDIREVED